MDSEGKKERKGEGKVERRGEKRNLKATDLYQVPHLRTPFLSLRVMFFQLYSGIFIAQIPSNWPDK